MHPQLHKVQLRPACRAAPKVFWEWEGCSAQPNVVRHFHEGLSRIHGMSVSRGGEGQPALYLTATCSPGSSHLLLLQQLRAPGSRTSSFSTQLLLVKLWTPTKWRAVHIYRLEEMLWMTAHCILACKGRSIIERARIMDTTHSLLMFLYIYLFNYWWLKRHAVLADALLERLRIYPSVAEGLTCSLPGQWKKATLFCALQQIAN